MRCFLAMKTKVARQPFVKIGSLPVPLEVDAFVFHGSQMAFDEHVSKRTSSTVQTAVCAAQS